jgi:hypothetical protein
LWVWNSNQELESFVGFGAKNVTIEYSLDGSTWTALAGVPEFARGTGGATYTYNTTVSFGGVQAKYVKLTINATWGGIPQASLSEVRFLAVPVQARQPLPADAATGVNLDVNLSWRSGREAASHKVYFGQDRRRGYGGSRHSHDAASPWRTWGRHDLYWRVERSPRPGPVSMKACLEPHHPGVRIVDDLESHTDDEQPHLRVLGDLACTSNSQVGYAQAPFAEQAVVHGGKQSMPLSYKNTGGFSLSEAERTFDTPQDWTRGGIATLAVYFRGDPNNTTGRLYLKINGVKVAYNGDAAALKAATWTQWDVALASVNTNLTKVTKLAIGVDSGGTGILYVDDLRLLPAASVAAPAITITVSPATNVKATGNDGTIQSINGMIASSCWARPRPISRSTLTIRPPTRTTSSARYLDDAKVITVEPVPVTTIFVIERGATCRVHQALNAAGEPIGEPQPFVAANWFKTNVTIAGQTAGAVVITSTAPIGCIQFLPPAGGVTGVDPASVSGVPAQ